MFRDMGQFTYSKFKVTGVLGFAHIGMGIGGGALNYVVVPIQWITKAFPLISR